MVSSTKRYISDPAFKYVDYDPNEHETRVLCGDPIANSLQWIFDFAHDLSARSYEKVHPNELIEIVLHNHNNCNSGLSPSNTPRTIILNKGPYFPPNEFWKHIDILLGFEIKRTTIFVLAVNIDYSLKPFLVKSHSSLIP